MEATAGLDSWGKFFALVGVPAGICVLFMAGVFAIVFLIFKPIGNRMVAAMETFLLDLTHRLQSFDGEISALKQDHATQIVEARSGVASLHDKIDARFNELHTKIDANLGRCQRKGSE